MSSLKNATNAHDATGEQPPVNLQSPAPEVTQPTALPTVPNALCQWRKRWTALWIAETRQAMAAKEARDE